MEHMFECVCLNAATFWSCLALQGADTFNSRNKVLSMTISNSVYGIGYVKHASDYMPRWQDLSIPLANFGCSQIIYSDTRQWLYIFNQSEKICLELHMWWDIGYESHETGAFPNPPNKWNANSLSTNMMQD